MKVLSKALTPEGVRGGFSAKTICTPYLLATPIIAHPKTFTFRLNQRTTPVHASLALHPPAVVRLCPTVIRTKGIPSTFLAFGRQAEGVMYHWRTNSLRSRSSDSASLLHSHLPCVGSAFGYSWRCVLPAAITQNEENDEQKKGNRGRLDSKP